MELSRRWLGPRESRAVTPQKGVGPVMANYAW
jgi:hypothetical protein